MGYSKLNLNYSQLVEDGLTNRYMGYRATMFDIHSEVEWVAEQLDVPVTLIWGWVIAEQGWRFLPYHAQSNNYWSAMPSHARAYTYPTMRASSEAFVKTIKNRFVGWTGDRAERARQLWPTGQKLKDWDVEGIKAWHALRATSVMNGNPNPPPDAVAGIAKIAGDVVRYIQNSQSRNTALESTGMERKEEKKTKTPAPVGVTNDFDTNTMSIKWQDSVSDLTFKQSVMLPGSFFGQRKKVFGTGVEFHPGIDICVLLSFYRLRNMEATAIADSEVVEVFNGITGSTGGTGYGCYVILVYNVGGRAFFSIYGHLKGGSGKPQASLRPGQSIPKGAVIGHIGSTGMSTGPHLHFEVRPGPPWAERSKIRGLTDYLRLAPVDPLKTFDGGANSKAVRLTLETNPSLAGLADGSSSDNLDESVKEEIAVRTATNNRFSNRNYIIQSVLNNYV